MPGRATTSLRRGKGILTPPQPRAYRAGSHRHRLAVRLVVALVGGRGEHGLRRVVEVGVRQRAVARQHGLQRGEPVLVVRPRLAAVARLPPLDRIDQRELELAPLVLPGVVGRHGHRERPQLPRLLERSALAPASRSPAPRRGGGRRRAPSRPAGSPSGRLRRAGADHGVAGDERGQLLLARGPRCPPAAPGAPSSASPTTESHTRTSTESGTSKPKSSPAPSAARAPSARGTPGPCTSSAAAPAPATGSRSTACRRSTLCTVVGVLDDDHVLALQPADAQLRARRGGVGEEPGLELRVGPRLGDDLGAELRPDLVLVDLGEPVDRGGRHDPFSIMMASSALTRAAISSWVRMCTVMRLPCLGAGTM